MFKPYIKVNHWREAFTEEWRLRWPDFEPWEFATDSGALLISTDLLDKLQTLRDRYGQALRINCGYRDEQHNKRVGGGKRSWHMKGVAVDIHIKSVSMGRKLEKLAREIGFTAVGRYNGVNTRGRFIHLDTRPPKPSGALYQWGSWNIT